MADETFLPLHHPVQVWVQNDLLAFSGSVFGGIIEKNHVFSARLAKWQLQQFLLMSVHPTGHLGSGYSFFHQDLMVVMKSFFQCRFQFSTSPALCNAIMDPLLLLGGTNTGSVW